MKDYFEKDFDKMKKFKNYLIHNNIKKIIQEINLKVERNELYISLLQKSREKAEQKKMKRLKTSSPSRKGIKRKSTIIKSST